MLDVARTEDRLSQQRRRERLKEELKELKEMVINLKMEKKQLQIALHLFLSMAFDDPFPFWLFGFSSLARLRGCSGSDCVLVAFEGLERFGCAYATWLQTRRGRDHRRPSKEKDAGIGCRSRDAENVSRKS
jgi:hypothetical protein